MSDTGGGTVAGGGRALLPRVGGGGEGDPDATKGVDVKKPEGQRVVGYVRVSDPSQIEAHRSTHSERRLNVGACATDTPSSASTPRRGSPPEASASSAARGSYDFFRMRRKASLTSSLST